MARPGPANDEERLPWLEPYRETMATKAKAARRSHGGLVAVVGALAVLVAAGGGYIIGQRAPQASVPSTEIAVRPVTPSPATIPPPQPEAPAVAGPLAEADVPHQPVRVARATPHRAARPVFRQRKIRTAGIESGKIRAVRAAQEHRYAPPPIAYRPWPKMPSPGPAGQVIQLGAFTSSARANAALRQRLARYPLFTRMPRVVVPVITRPRGQILYVLRLGTTSRQQSEIICRNLRASGDHCLVIG